MNWKDIPGYEGLYQVSDCGKVKSLSRTVLRKNGLQYYIKEKILKSRISSKGNGYHYVNLHKEESQKSFFVHRLVMYAFSYVDKNMTVNHIDENKMNNHISNLEYLTMGDNTRIYHKNNPTKKILDTHTGVIYNSLISASRFMYNSGETSSKWSYFHKIKNNKQDRFKIIY
jgi:hypothetical protein